jgi:purine-binding chemotaxis protein CheW
LRLRFGMPPAQFQKTTCVVVVQLKSASDTPSHMGLIVDAVDEVANLAQGDLAETPDFGPQLSTEYLLGMAKLKAKVLALLDIDRLLPAPNLEPSSRVVAGP